MYKNHTFHDIYKRNISVIEYKRNISQKCYWLAKE